MKPTDWDQFLKQIVIDYGLRGKLKEIFLVRFAYENWRKPDTEVWELADAASHETYKKQMTELYRYFTNDQPEGCPELDSHSRGPGKFRILLEWFKDIKYPQWQHVSPTTQITETTLAPITPAVTGETTFYIQRPPIETDCCQEIMKPGGLVRIKAPEKMGKTALLNTILAYAQTCHYQRVYLNLQEAETAMFASLDKFLRWFSANISLKLGLKPSLDDYWDEDLFGSLVSCKTYVQSHILAQLDSPLVLGLDNLDRVFDYSDIAQDFLPMLRFWHEEANNLEVWRKLRLVIANSTEAYIKLDANQSPFNVGRMVKLPGFNLEQMQTLAQQYGWEPDKIEGFIESLDGLVNGHPYLVRMAFDALQNESTNPEQLLREAPTQGGIYAGHLRRHWENLQSSPALAEAMQTVVTTSEGVQLDPLVAYKLESMGLITLMGDTAQPSCELYRQYFQDNL